MDRTRPTSREQTLIGLKMSYANTMRLATQVRADYRDVGRVSCTAGVGGNNGLMASIRFAMSREDGAFLRTPSR